MSVFAFEKVMQVLQRYANVPPADARELAEALTLDETQENLIIRVHPINGTDPATTRRIFTQADADSITFATIAAAVSSIPSDVQHDVEIRIADGDWTLPAATEPFGNWGRFRVALTKRITLRSESISERVPGTTSYAVTGSTADSAALEGAINLAADPGFGANFLRDNFAKVVSGTGNVGGGVQRYRTISASAGTVVTIAGAGMNPELDGTSVVEFHRPAARLTIPGSVTDLFLQGPGPRYEAAAIPNNGVQGSPFFQAMGFVGIELIGTAQSRLLFKEVDLNLDVAVFNNVLLRPASGFIQPDSIVVKSGGTGTLILQSGAFLRTSGTPNILLRNAALGWQLFGNLAGLSPTTRIHGVSFYDLTSHAFDAQSARMFLFGPVASTTRVYAVNVAGHFFNLLRAWLELPAGFTSLPVGTAGAVNLDATSTTYATIDAAAGDTVVGVKHSVAASQ